MVRKEGVNVVWKGHGIGVCIASIGKVKETDMDETMDAAASAGTEPTPERADPADPRVSRRGLLRKAPVAAAAALGATAILDRPASAADGSAVSAGNITTAEHRTAVKYDGTTGFVGVVLIGNDSTYDGSGANSPAGVGGWAGAGTTVGAGGVANGVYGYTDNGGGNGVVGYNSNAVSGSGSGVLGLAFGATATGVSGTNSLGTAVSGSSDSTAGSATAIHGVITSTSPRGCSSAVRRQNNRSGGVGRGGVGVQVG